MRDEDIRIGDVVRVRRWSDMKAEYGGGTSGYSIYTRNENGDVTGCFGTWMCFLCGKLFTVDSVCRNNNACNAYRFKEDDSGVNVYFLTAEMLEPVIEDELEVADDNEIKALFDYDG